MSYELWVVSYEFCKFLYFSFSCKDAKSQSLVWVVVLHFNINILFTSLRVVLSQRNGDKIVSRSCVNLDTFSIALHSIENTRFDGDLFLRQWHS